MRIYVEMKKVAILAALLTMSAAALANMWTLSSQQFVTNKWYCTYRLEGSNPPIVRTIESSMPCQTAIFLP
jgi:hypothetical protein